MVVIVLNEELGDFPGGSVAKALCFQCRGAQVRFLVGELDPTCHKEDQRSCNQDLAQSNKCLKK